MQRPATDDGLFHDGNPATGQKGTPITAEWLNALISVGALFHGTAKPPDPALGDDGDHYINSTAQLIFGPKTAGAWGVGVDFKGLKGDTGNTGLTGNPYKVYATLAEANADLTNIPADGLIWVNADATPANIGYWAKTGGVLVQSSYDRVAITETAIDKITKITKEKDASIFDYAITDETGKTVLGIQPDGITHIAGIGADSKGNVLPFYNENGDLSATQKNIDKVAYAISDEMGTGERDRSCLGKAQSCRYHQA